MWPKIVIKESYIHEIRPMVTLKKITRLKSRSNKWSLSHQIKWWLIIFHKMHKIFVLVVTNMAEIYTDVNPNNFCPFWCPTTCCSLILYNVFFSLRICIIILMTNFNPMTVIYTCIGIRIRVEKLILQKNTLQ